MTTIYVLTGYDRGAVVRRHYTTDPAARDAVTALVLRGGWGTPITIEPVELHGVVALDPVPAGQAATEAEPADQPDDRRAELRRIAPGPWRIVGSALTRVLDSRGEGLFQVEGSVTTDREDELIASRLVDLVNRPASIPPLVQAVVDAARPWMSWVGSRRDLHPAAQALYDSVQVLDTAETEGQS